jgi:hypothetical protein
VAKRSRNTLAKWEVALVKGINIDRDCSRTQGLCAANGQDGKADDEIRAAMAINPAKT